ncbi:hypothetical protein [uncultured Williamsia sp.]|uniref:nSTAND1 domain-containing NTPase n=1 Tax=uncultured Williamsia sp. TaxID=259311 RepID=UPI00261C165B|nr:hypothetical protein [uncultured Williamsia sp.]
MYADLRARPRVDAAGHSTHPTSTDAASVADDPSPRPDDASPYRPLTAYTEVDAAVFAGRTDLRRRLHLRVTAGEGAVVLLGPSGSGKTSLLRAGLIPEVRASGLRTRTDRVDASTVILRPGSDAVASLAAAVGLDRSAVDDASAAPDLVAASDVVSVTATGRHRACLLVVDQVEELFRWCGSADRALFLRLIDTLAGDSRFAVVLGLGAEYAAQALTEPVLATALDTRSVVLTPMSTPEVVEAVDLPARVAGVRTESGLGEAIAADLTRVDADTPPLVALGVMLDHLWHTRIADTDVAMTMKAYRASDPITEITAIAADRAWSRFTPVDRDTARILLLAAADGSPSARDTTHLLRRVARPHLDRVLSRLTEAHLVRVVEGRVELTHPALITAWPRLSAWIADRRVQAPLRDRVTTDAARWAQGGRPADELYDTDRLRRAESALEPFDELGSDAASFLERSRDRLRLHRSRRRVLATVGVLVAIVSLVLAVVFGVGTQRSDAQRDAARITSLIERSSALAQTNPSASAAAARAAFAADPADAGAEAAVLATQTRPLARPLGVGATRAVATPAADPAAPSVVVGPAGGLTVVGATGPGGSIVDAGVADGPQSVAISGTTAMGVVSDGAIRLWRIGSGLAPSPVGTVPTSRPAVAVVAIPEPNRFAVVDAAGTLRIVAVDDPARPTVAATAALGGTPTALAAGPDGVVVGATDGGATVVDPRTGALVGSLPSVDGAVTAVATTTGYTALADGAGQVSVVRVGADGLATGPATDLAGDHSRVGSLSFSPSGPGRPAPVLAVTADGITDIVDPARPAASTPQISPLRSPGGITAARFAPDGVLVSTGADGARSWSLPTGTIPGTIGTAATPSCSIARSICAVPHLDGPVQVVDISDPRAPVVGGVVDAPDHFDGAAVAPSGLWMMTVDAGHRAQLWDTRTFAAPVAVGAPVQLGPGPIGVIAFSPTSSLIAMSRNGGASTGIWSVTPRGLVAIGDLDIGTRATAAAWSSDGGQIAVGGPTGVLRWTVSSTGVGAISGRIAPSTPVTALAYGLALGEGEPGSDSRAALRPVVVVGDATGGVSRFDVGTGGALGPRVSLGSTAVTSVAAVGATTATGSADGSIHRVAANGSAVRVADLYPAQGSGVVHVGPSGGDDIIAVGDETASRVMTLRTQTVDQRICAATGC